MKSKYLECGKIINTHGVMGAVKLENRCDKPSVLASLPQIYFKRGNEYEPQKVKKASVFKEFVIMQLEGTEDFDAALALKNTLVYADRSDIPLKEGDFFVADLIGLSVIDADNGKEYGKISDVTNRGASDIYVVDTPYGEKLLPAVKEFVKRVDTEAGVYVTPILGLLDDGTVEDL